jgi:hypothetical protein
MKYYVYKHIRLDKNIPFYIGIGTTDERFSLNMKSRYKRAFSKEIKRGSSWHKIYKKAGLKVEIVNEFPDKESVKAEEVRLIKLYGRRDFHVGPLVNHTDGADGRLSPNEHSMKKVGWNLQQYTNAKKKTVYQYNSLTGAFIKKWNSLTEASKSFGSISNSGILQSCKKKIKSYKESIWFYDYQGEYVTPKDNIRKSRKMINKLDINTGEIIKTYNSLSIASELDNNPSFKAISRCALGKSKSSGGFNWEYI